MAAHPTNVCRCTPLIFGRAPHDHSAAYPTNIWRGTPLLFWGTHAIFLRGPPAIVLGGPPLLFLRSPAIVLGGPPLFALPLIFLCALTLWWTYFYSRVTYPAFIFLCTPAVPFLCEYWYINSPRSTGQINVHPPPSLVPVRQISDVSPQLHRAPPRDPHPICFAYTPRTFSQQVTQTRLRFAPKTLRNESSKFQQQQKTIR